MTLQGLAILSLPNCCITLVGSPTSLFSEASLGQQTLFLWQHVPFPLGSNRFAVFYGPGLPVRIKPSSLMYMPLPSAHFQALNNHRGVSGCSPLLGSSATFPNTEWLSPLLLTQHPLLAHADLLLNHFPHRHELLGKRPLNMHPRMTLRRSLPPSALLPVSSHCVCHCLVTGFSLFQQNKHSVKSPSKTEGAATLLQMQAGQLLCLQHLRPGHVSIAIVPRFRMGLWL